VGSTHQKGSAPIGVRRAGRADAAAIATITERLTLQAVDAGGRDPRDGWILCVSTAAQIAERMAKGSEYWVATSPTGEVIAYQEITQNGLPRELDLHQVVDGRDAEIRDLLEGDEPFLYMSQIAVDPDHRRQGVASRLQAEVLEHYPADCPLACHVVIYTDADYEALGGKAKRADAMPHFNDASHRYHHAAGYELVAYSCNVGGDPSNTNVAPYTSGKASVCSGLYLRRPNAEAKPYVDPMQTVAANPFTGAIDQT